MVLLKNLPRWRAANSRPYELKNFEPSAKYAPCTMRYVCVGAAISRPVVSPLGKQRRRKAPTIQYRTLYGKIGRYNVKTWYFGNIAAPVRPIWFCSKICYGGGRLVAVILWCDRPRRSLDFDSLRGAPPLRLVRATLAGGKENISPRHRIFLEKSLTIFHFSL